MGLARAFSKEINKLRRYTLVILALIFSFFIPSAVLAGTAEFAYVKFKSGVDYKKEHGRLGVELVYHSKSLDIDYVRDDSPICERYKNNNNVEFCEIAPTKVEKTELNECLNLEVFSTKIIPLDGLPKIEKKITDCSLFASASNELTRIGLTPFWAQEITGADLARDLVLNLRGEDVTFGLFEDVKISSVPSEILSPEMKICRNRPETAGCPDVSENSEKERSYHHGTLVTALVADPIVGTAATAKLAVSAIYPDRRSLIEENYGASFLPTIDQMVDRKIGLLCSSVVLTKYEAFDEAFSKLQSKGTIIVQGSGNSYPQETVQGVQKGTILVGSIGPEGLASGFSQHGEHVSILAPVENHLLTRLNGKLERIDGTSAAQPQVCGAIANVIALLPGLTEAEAAKILSSTAIPTLNSLEKPRKNGAGTLNAFKMAAVAERLMSEWPQNRNRIFTDTKIYNFSESNALAGEAQKKLKSKKLCERHEGLLQLRKAVLLSPENKEIRKQLADFYRSEKLVRNARFYENMNGVSISALEKMWSELGSEKHEASTIARAAANYGGQAKPLIRKIFLEATKKEVMEVAADSAEKVFGKDASI